MEAELQAAEVRSVSLQNYIRVVRGNRNFRRLWLAQIISETGDWFYTLAIYTLLFELTGRASSVAFALVLQVLPLTFMGTISGVVNDRISRKRVMIISDLARMVIVALMLLVRSKSTVWLVYPLLLFETIMVSFFEPARTASVPNLVSKEDLVVANTIASSTWSVNLLLGSAIGGVVAAFLGRDAVFVLNAASFLFSALLIGGMRFTEPHVDAAPRLAFKDLVGIGPVLEGVRYVRQNRSLLFTMFVKSGLFVIGPSWVLFTVMGKREFPVQWHGISAERGAMLGMSLLMGARGVGALLGPVIAAPWAGHREHRLRLGILLGFIADVIGYCLLGAATNVWFACLSVVFAHCGGSIVWVFSTTLLQMGTEDRFRGRVFAAELSFTMLNIAIGAYLAGMAVDHGISVREVAAAAAVLMVVPAVLWGFTIRQLNDRTDRAAWEAAD